MAVVHSQRQGGRIRVDHKEQHHGDHAEPKGHHLHGHQSRRIHQDGDGIDVVRCGVQGHNFPRGLNPHEAQSHEVAPGESLTQNARRVPQERLDHGTVTHAEGLEQAHLAASFNDAH